MDLSEGRKVQAIRAARYPEQIYENATECKVLFCQLRLQVKSNAISDKAPNGDPSFTVIQQYEQRFWAWATGLGVFARPNLSLDTKLQDHDEVKDLVLMILGILRSNLDEALVVKSNDGKSPIAVIACEKDRNNAHRIREALYGMCGALSRLDRLSILIRKGSRRNLDHKVRNFARNNPDEDFDRIIGLVLRHFFPAMGESLYEQVHDSITHRRHRLLYERRHKQNIVTSHRTPHTSDIEPEESLERTFPAERNIAKASDLRDESQSTNILESKSGRSTLDKDVLKQASSPPASIASHSSFSTATAGEVDYPDPPKVKIGESLVQCPICYATLNAATAISKARWRRHVDEDLEPWVCLSEECTQPLVFFVKSRYWREHMQHAHTENWPQLLHNEETWVCSIDHNTERPPTFADADALASHILTLHKRVVATIGTDEVKEFAARSRIHNPGLPNVCPICGIHMEQIQNGTERYVGSLSPIDSFPEKYPALDLQKLSKHVAQHLKMLAFRSLDGLLEDEEEADEQASRKINMVSKASNGTADSLDTDFDSEGWSVPYSDDVRLDLREFEDIHVPAYTIQQVIVDDTKERERCLEKEPRPRQTLEWAFIRRTSSTDTQDPLLEDLRSKQIEISGESSSPILRDLCLLSLDGDDFGAAEVRGLCTIYVLRDIMNRLNDARKKDLDLPPVKPCEVFDLVGGTRCGGLIAVMLGRLEMSVDECMHKYMRLPKDMWKPTVSSLTKSIAFPRHSSARFEMSVRQALENNGISVEEDFNNGEDHRCKTFVCACSGDSSELVLLRSYSLSTEPKIHPKIWQAARATVAGPEFFKAFVIGTETFIDGGLKANKPGRQVESEAGRIWCQHSANLDSRLQCLISVGTRSSDPRNTTTPSLGKPHVVDSPDGFIPHRDSDHTEPVGAKKWFAEGRYFRLTVPSQEYVGLDVWNSQGKVLHQEISLYLASPEISSQIDICVETLKHKKPLVKKKRQRFFSVPYSRNTHYIGRQKELMELQSMVHANEGVARTAITGMGGIGKTQLALELAYRFKDEYKDCSVFWLPSDSAEILEDSCSHLCQALGLIKDPGRHDSSLVQEYLNNEEESRFLLVLDNIEDFETTRRFWASNRNGCIVSTTRNMEQARSVSPEFRITELRLMDRHDAFEFMKAQMPKYDFSRDPRAEVEGSELVERLGYLPLAIIHAAGYILRSGVTFKNFMATYDHRIRDLSDAPDSSRPLQVIWDFVLDQLSSVASDYISFMACIHPDAIPLSLLPTEHGNQERSNAIASLTERHLVNFNEADRTLCIHHALKLAVRVRLEESMTLVQWTEIAMKRLVEVLSSSSPEHDNAGQRSKYFVHAMHLLENETPGVDKEVKFELAVMVGDYLDTVGNFEAAERLLEDALSGSDTSESFAGTPVWVHVAAFTILAAAKMSTGKLDEAENLQRKALEISSRVFGEEHPQTLDCMGKLADVLSAREKFEEAEQILRKLLEVRPKVLGEDHSDTCTVMDALSALYYQQGRLDEADDLAGHTLETSVRTIGRNAPETLTRMSNLAVIWRSQGRQQEAVQLMEECVEISKGTLGSDHPETVASQKMLQAWQDEETKDLSSEGDDVHEEEERTRMDDGGKGKNVLR